MASAKTSRFATGGARRLGLRSALGTINRAPSSQGSAVEELEAENVLLREENARLKTRGARRAELADIRLAYDGLTDDQQAEQGDEALRMVAEALCARDALLDVARELEQSMQVLQGRLSTLGSGPQLTSSTTGADVVRLDAQKKNRREAS